MNTSMKSERRRGVWLLYLLILCVVLLPASTFAVTGSQVAADGTYSGSCGKDGATASVTVSGGKITNISVSGSDSRWSSLVSQVKSYYTGKSADYNTVDAISGATTAKKGKYSKYVKTGVLAAIKSAPVAETGTGDSGSGSGGTTTVYDYEKYDVPTAMTGPTLQDVINETPLYYKNGDNYVKVNCYVMSNYAYYFYLDGNSFSSYFAMGYGSTSVDIKDSNIWNNLYRAIPVEVGKEDPYMVNYDVQGHGQPMDSVLVDPGAVPEKPADPTDEGYTFGGWYLDDDCTEEYKFDKGITEDIILYAKWTKIKKDYGADAITYSADFAVNGSGHVYNAVMNVIVKAGQIIALETTGDGDWSSLIAKAIANYENKSVADAKTQVAMDVDAVSSASVYSQGFYGGIRDALAKALTDNEGDDNKEDQDGDNSGGAGGDSSTNKGSNTGSDSSNNKGNNGTSSGNSGTTSKSTADKQAEADIAKALGVDAKTATAIHNVAKQLGVSLDTLKITEKTVTNKTDDGDIKGSKFGRLKPMTKKQTKKSVTLKWNRIAKADGYLIYGNQCNSKGKVYKCKLLKNVTKNSTTRWTHKKLKKGTYYKYQVIAYKIVNGQKITIDSGPMIHAVTKGGKYCVAKSVKVSKVGAKKKATKITLKKGKKAVIKASEVKQYKKLKLSKHRKLCYESSNTKVATVTKAGKIKAVGKGKCKIWVYAQNGKYKTVSVTVK